MLLFNIQSQRVINKRNLLAEAFFGNLLEDQTIIRFIKMFKKQKLNKNHFVDIKNKIYIVETGTIQVLISYYEELALQQDSEVPKRYFNIQQPIKKTLNLTSIQEKNTFGELELFYPQGQNNYQYQVSSFDAQFYYISQQNLAEIFEQYPKAQPYLINLAKKKLRLYQNLKQIKLKLSKTNADQLEFNTNNEDQNIKPKLVNLKNPAQAKIYFKIKQYASSHSKNCSNQSMIGLEHLRSQYNIIDKQSTTDETKEKELAEQLKFQKELLENLKTKQATELEFKKIQQKMMQQSIDVINKIKRRGQQNLLKFNKSLNNIQLLNSNQNSPINKVNEVTSPQNKLNEVTSLQNKLLKQKRRAFKRFQSNSIILHPTDNEQYSPIHSLKSFHQFKFDGESPKNITKCASSKFQFYIKTLHKNLIHQEKALETSYKKFRPYKSSSIQLSNIPLPHQQGNNNTQYVQPEQIKQKTNQINIIQSLKQIVHKPYFSSKKLATPSQKQLQQKSFVISLKKLSPFL